MKTKNSFIAGGSRDLFDSGACSIGRGWAPISTEQDDWYFGIWANPFALQITSYMEGDICEKQAESPAEFCKELNDQKQWHIDNGLRFFGIDNGLEDYAPRMADCFRGMGLGDLFHGWELAS